MSGLRGVIISPAALALLLGSLVACRVSGTFVCETADQCRRGPAGGACVAGSCAFADEACESGWRYAESAEEDVAGRCLGGTPPADCAAWAARSVDPCLLPTPLGPLQLEGALYTYDTDTGALIGGDAAPPASVVLVQADLSAVRVASVTGFTVGPGASLRLTGSLPLIVAAWEDTAIHGTIDASSGTSGAFGAGANPAVCDDAPAGPGREAAPTGGSGGGGGGGFQGAGGRGGAADYPLLSPGGTPGPVVASPVVVRGGCPGARSGAAGVSAVAPSTPATTAVGGAGGGAVQLAARGALLVGVGGGILAGGAGGGGAPFGSECGGGGGGAGGFVGLEGASVVVRGLLAANGGGGGAAALRTAPGAPGADGKADDTAAAGGNAVQCGTNGGIGSALATLAGADVPSSQQMCGGGGGGGGAGFVKLRSLATAVEPPAIVSPPAIFESP